MEPEQEDLAFKALVADFLKKHFPSGANTPAEKVSLIQIQLAMYEAREWAIGRERARFDVLKNSLLAALSS